MQLLREGGAQPLGDGGAQQEALHVGRMSGQDLLGEVLDHRLVVATEVGGPVPRLLAGQEQGGEAEAGRPSLGALDEQLGVTGSQLDAVVGQDQGGLVRPEREVARTGSR